jgi:predicted transcriptional regulator
MATASTHRLKPDVQAGLDYLSKALHRPKNKLMNEAVHLYVQQKSRELEQQMEATLEAIRAYGAKDPDFEKAIDEFVDAEASLARKDPAEGRIIAPAGEVQSEIRNLLHA